MVPLPGAWSIKYCLVAYAIGIGTDRNDEDGQSAERFVGQIVYALRKYALVGAAKQQREWLPIDSGGRSVTRKLRFGECQGELLSFKRSHERIAKDGFKLVDRIEDKHGFGLIRHAFGCGRWLIRDQAKGNSRP